LSTYPVDNLVDRVCESSREARFF